MTPPDPETWTEEAEPSSSGDSTWTDEAAGRAVPSRPTADGPERYVEGPVLGRGGLADVRAARDRRLGRDVAVKRLRRPDQVTARLRFVREARVAAQLEHPNIVPVHDVGSDADGTPFYTMKYVRGTSLADALRGKADLGERLGLLSAFVSVCQAMAYAHDRRIIHRDLKPQNIMLGEFGEALVVDWGLARLLDEPESIDGAEETNCLDAEVDIDGAALTRVGSVNGTPAYMAPEQARGEATGPYTDVYALGGILFELLTGRSPRAHTATAEQQLAWAREGFLPPLLGLQPDAPRELVAIAERAMARVPADRYPTAAGMAEDLQRWTQGLLVEAHSYSAVERIARWLRVYRTVLALAALGLFGMVVVGAVGFQRARTERDRAQKSEQAQKALATAARQDRARLLADRADRALREGDVVTAKAFAVASLQDDELPDARGVLLRSWGQAGVTPVEEMLAPHACHAVALAVDGVFCLGEGHVSKVSWSAGPQWTVPIDGAPDRLAPSGQTLWVSTESGVRGLDAATGAVVKELGGSEVRNMALSSWGEPMWLEGERAAVVMRGDPETRKLGPPFASAILPGGPYGPTLLRALGRLERFDGEPFDVAIERVAYDAVRLDDGWLVAGADVVRVSDDGRSRSLGGAWGGVGRIVVDGDVAAMLTVRGEVLVVHLPTWSVMARLPGETDVRGAMALVGTSLATAHGRRVLRWRVEPPGLPQRIEPGPWDRSAVRDDGAVRLLCGDRGAFALWHAGEPSPRPEQLSALGVTLVCSFYGETAMLGWSRGAWRVPPTGPPEPIVGRSNHVVGHDEGRALMMFEDTLFHEEQRLGVLLASASAGTIVAVDGDLAHIWSWDGSSYVLAQDVAIDPDRTFDVLPDGTVGELVEGSSRVRVRRPGSVVELVGHASRVTAMSATGVPEVVATGAQDGTVILWSLDTGEALASVPCGDGAVAILQYSSARNALDVSTFDGRFQTLFLDPLLLNAAVLEEGLRRDHGVRVEDAALRITGPSAPGSPP
jgi:tRNA A-37 threonylcarbamoyl transferase component Bud32